MHADSELNWLDKMNLSTAKGWGIGPVTLHMDRFIYGLFCAINTVAFVGMVIRPSWIMKEMVSRHPLLGFGGFLLLIVAYTVPVYLFAHPVSMLKTKSIRGWERAGYLALYFFLSAGLYICTFALSLWLYGPTEMSS